MTGRRALGQGLQAARRAWRYVAWSWLLDLVVAAVVALPLVLALDAAAGPQADAAALAARFDERFFAELAASNPALFGRWDLRLALCTAAAVLLHAFLAGGFIEVLARRGAAGEPDPVTVPRFFGRCVARAGRMIAISVLAAVALALVGGLLHGGLAPRLREAVRDAPGERVRLLATLGPGGVYLLLIAVVATWADAARACAVLGDLEVVPALGRGARLLWRHRGALLVVGLGAFGLQVAALAAFVALDAAVPQGGWGGILLVIALAQGLALWRHGVRAAGIAATARLCCADLAVGASGVDDDEAAPAAEFAVTEAP